MGIRSRVAIVLLGIVMVSWGCASNKNDCTSGQACWKDGGADLAGPRDGVLDLWGAALETARDLQSQADIGAEIAVVDLGAATGEDVVPQDASSPAVPPADALTPADSPLADGSVVDPTPADAAPADVPLVDTPLPPTSPPADAQIADANPGDPRTSDASAAKEVGDLPMKSGDFSNANLRGLTLSAGALFPSFDPSARTYGASVANAISSVTITPTAEEAEASIAVNGQSITSGHTTPDISLGVGSNTITVVVTAPDLTTTKTYTVIYARAEPLPGNANLHGLALSAGTLSPSFAASTASYSASVANAISSVAITPTAEETGARIAVNGHAVSSGHACAGISLNVGSNTIAVAVTASDLITTKTYTVTVTRAEPLSSNAKLVGLALSVGTLSPSFDALTTSYGVSVANSVSSVAITPGAEEIDAIIAVNGQSVTSGHASSSISLSVGSNTITVVVTAPDLTTTKTYTVTIARAEPLSANASLQGLAVSAGTLSPSFDASTTSYEVSVTNTVSSVAVTPGAEEDGASITVNGQTVTSGQASASISLSVGSNTITVVVTAPDLTTTKTYTVTMTRAEPLSSNANLQELTLSAGTLSPSFDASTASYDVSVANTVSSVAVTPSAEENGASITVNGQGVTSGHASSSISLSVGGNTITVVVTAPDLTTTKTYTVTMTRAEPLSSNANLQGLTLSAGTLSPSFVTSTTSYSVAVGNAVSSVAVTPGAEEAGASITVNGQGVVSGQASSGCSLNVGSNTITVVLTAPDLTTTKTYSVTVTRAEPPSSNASLSALSISPGSLSPAFDSSVTSYNVSVDALCGYVTVTPAGAPGATMTVNGATVDSGSGKSVNLNAGANTIAIVVTAEDGSTTNTTTVTVNKEAVCEDLLDAVTCTRAECQWSDGTCITPSVASACETLDEDTCVATSGCMWGGICVANSP